MGFGSFSDQFEIKVNYKTYEKTTNRISTKKTGWKEYDRIIERREKKLDTDSK